MGEVWFERKTVGIDCHGLFDDRMVSMSGNGGSYWRLRAFRALVFIPKGFFTSCMWWALCGAFT